MKNTFKLFGVMLLASATLFAACDPTEEEGTNNGGTNNDGKTQYTITVQANNADWGTVTGGGLADSGSAITLTATAAADYDFVNWTMPDGTTSQNNPLVVVVTGNATYTANFAEQSGVKATFGTNTWNAGYINALYSASEATFKIVATQTSDPTSYPWIEVGYTWEGNLATGVYNGQPTVNISEGTASRGNPYLWYYTVDDNMQLGGKACGDYWNKDVTLNITAFDATSLTISLIANSTMGHLPECLEGVDFANTTEESCTMKVSGVRLTASAKSLVRQNGPAKLSVR